MVGGLRSPIHFETPSHDPIGWYREPRNASFDFTDPRHWFPAAFDRIFGLNLEVDRGLYPISYLFVLHGPAAFTPSLWR